METARTHKKQIIILLIIVLILTIVGGTYIYNKEKTKEIGKLVDYIPAEEITQEQLRRTIVSLYFANKETKILIPEARTIDVKELVKQPYETLLNLLIEGPKDEKLERTIPEGTKINKVELKNKILYIDFSEEFISNHTGGVEAESNTIYSIVNTLTQLNEIESIKILINGQENQAFSDNQVKFNEIFVQKE